MVKIEHVLQVVVRSAAWDWMCREYLPDGPVRPGADPRSPGPAPSPSFQELRQVYCASCGKRFRATTGTPILETSWQPEEYVQCLILHLAGKSPAEIGTHLGKSGHAIRDMLERIQLRHNPLRAMASFHGMHAMS